MVRTIYQSDKYEEYIQLNSIYKELLYELKKRVLTRLDTKQPMEVFAVYYYMVKNGFLSINHSFLVENKSDLTDFLCPTSIVEGNGCCRNLASFLTALLNVNGYHCYNVKMGHYNQEFYSLSDDDYDYSDIEEPLIVDETKKGGLEALIEKIMSRKGKHTITYNHVATLLADNDSSYIMDPMLNTFYCINEGNVYPYFSNEKRSTNLEEDWMDSKIKIPSVSSMQLDSQELIKLYQEARLKCNDSFYTFQRFYLEHRELYEEIVFQRQQCLEKITKILRF